METIFRKAHKDDLDSIVSLLADDPLGQKRENADKIPDAQYQSAFDRIISDPHQELMVMCHLSGEVIGTFQLSYIQYLTYQGGIRAQVEAVRIKQKYQGLGLGTKMFEWAIQRAKEKGAHLIQLTTDKKRPDALKFYEKLGFENTHHGMKLHFSK